MTAKNYFEKIASDTGRSIGAAATGALAGGNIPGGVAAYYGKKDKDKGKNNIGKWAGGFGALSAGAGALVGRRFGAGKAIGAMSGAVGAAMGAGYYGLGRLWSKGKKENTQAKITSRV